MKKGFTLIELLAVIIIFAILMIIAIPNVLSTLENAKMNTFDAQAKSIWQAAEQKYIMDSMLGEQKECYGTGELDLATIAPHTSYYVYLNSAGKVTGIKVQDPIEKYIAEGANINSITVRVDESLSPTSAALECDHNRLEFLNVARKVWKAAEEKYTQESSSDFVCYSSYDDVLGIKTDNPNITYSIDLEDGIVKNFTVLDYTHKFKAIGSTYESIVITIDETLTEESAYRECNG